MNKVNEWIAWGALTALTSIPSLRAEEPSVRVDTDNTKIETKIKTDRYAPRNESEIRSDHGLRPCNKASALLGMEVKNNTNEKLGEVKDLVLDPQSGRIQYAVLAVGGFLGIGEKLLAVPMSALHPSATEERKLVMNASRERIAQAPGFTAASWPDVSDPNWEGTAFWNELKQSDIGSGATSETGYDRSKSSKPKETTGDKGVDVEKKQ